MCLWRGWRVPPAFLELAEKVACHCRGQVFETPWAEAWMATFHPSALLRMPDERARVKARRHFEEDLRKVADTLRSLG
ncbi:Uracil-DNA glycosylase, putative family 6 [Cystobacter fuscus]|uniref:Uracil-DNA glycosylase, putative family 6 n=1 Tax=Cystobacter fuscus TaxID=43 RepID=A0A250JKG5_9BACT|nr:hypothetical protein [Cystobacter fuscus]ATB44118.1 Uracil-DNA glycosylase, putative family 6 [Cystobacter fuscus]